jgi:hypothetical protein
MHINRIYVDHVALARSLSASVAPRQDTLARLPERPVEAHTKYRDRLHLHPRGRGRGHWRTLVRPTFPQPR